MSTYNPILEQDMLTPLSNQENDFSKTNISAILVAHDSHDWGRDITLICELLGSQDGVFGTRRKGKEEMDSMTKGRDTAGRTEGENSMPLIFSNPDLEWQRCVCES